MLDLLSDQGFQFWVPIQLQKAKGASKDGSAWLRGDCDSRSVRGGAFNTPSGDLYIKRRKFLPAGSRLDSVGIRLVRD